MIVFLISVTVSPKTTSIENVEAMSIIDSVTGKEMFTTKDSSNLLLDGEIKNLISPEIYPNNVRLIGCHYKY